MAEGNVPKKGAAVPKPDEKERDEEGGQQAAAATPDKPPDVARWVTASHDVRTTARWIVTSAASAAAVVFGGGPLLIKGELSGDAWLRGIGAVVAATIGAFGIVLIIGKTARVLLPYEVRFDDLPTHLRQRIKRSRGRGWFPDDIESPSKFIKRLRLWEREARVLPGELLQLRAKEEVVETAVLELEKRLKTARGPARVKLEDELSHLRGSAEQVATQVAQLQQAFETAKGNFKVYLEARDMILEYAEHDEVMRRHNDSRSWLVVGTLLSVAGAATYLLVLGYKPKEEPAPAKAPVLATLSRVESAASTTLWDTVGLTNCETIDKKVPVVKESGSGTDEDPYVVRTLPGKLNCPVVSFAVAGLAGQLTFPSDQTVKIDYVTTTTTTRAPAEH